MKISQFFQLYHPALETVLAREVPIPATLAEVEVLARAVEARSAELSAQLKLAEQEQQQLTVKAELLRGQVQQEKEQERRRVKAEEAIRERARLLQQISQLESLAAKNSAREARARESMEKQAEIIRVREAIKHQKERSQQLKRRAGQLVMRKGSCSVQLLAQKRKLLDGLQLGLNQLRERLGELKGIQEKLSRAYWSVIEKQVELRAQIANSAKLVGAHEELRRRVRSAGRTAKEQAFEAENQQFLEEERGLMKL